MAERSEAKNAKRSFASKIIIGDILTFLASLRSPIFSEIKIDN